MRHTFIFSFIIALLLCGTLSASAQRAKSEKYKILGISVEGNQSQAGTETSAIIANSGLKIGDVISVPGDETRQAIQRLWALRIFSDIQILIENKVDDGVYLLIKITEYQRMGRLEIIGADDVSEDDIKKKITIANGQILTPDDISRAVQSIKVLYEEEGHLLAEITPELVPFDTLGQTRAILRLTIDEGEKLTINSILFTGNNAFSESDLRGEMEDTKPKRWWHIILANPKFETKKYEEDKKRIENFYKKNGYIDAEILSDSIWYTPDKTRMNILMNLHEGKQYKVRDIIWTGNTVYNSSILTDRLGFSRGMIYDQEMFEQNLRGNQDQSDVASLYLDNGYLRFNLDPEVRRVSEDSLDITIHVYERNQFRIGQVDIKGNKKTKDNVIRRELYTRPGDYFSRALIIRSLRQLSQLNYFNPERIKPDTRFVDDQTVDLIYEVEEKSNDNVNTSIGYSGAYGVTGSLGFTINNFAITDPLGGGGGQILNFDWLFGEGSRYRTFSLSFTEPWLYNRPTTLGVSLFDTRQSYTWDLRQTGASLRVGRRLTWPDNYSRIDWTIKYQNNDIRSAGSSLYYELGQTNQLSVTQVLSRNSTDSPIFPTIGSNVAFSAEISGGPFLPGNVSYHKWILSTEWYIPVFGSTRLVFYAGSTIGYINGFYKNSHIPPIEFFYMGGTMISYVSTTPLRGYEDRTVGPMNDNGQEEGGQVMNKHTLELRYALTLNPIPIYLLGFMEGGNVYKDFRRTDFFDLKRSFGFGARLLIQPLGMIGFDYAYGADDVYPRDGVADGWRFHFQFGRGF